MGQQDIIELLKKQKDKWFSSKELAKELNKSQAAVASALRNLRRFNFVDYKKESYKTIHKIYFYKYKK